MARWGEKGTNEVGAAVVVGSEEDGGLVSVEDEVGEEEVADRDDGDVKELGHDSESGESVGRFGGRARELVVDEREKARTGMRRVLERDPERQAQRLRRG